MKRYRFYYFSGNKKWFYASPGAAYLTRDKAGWFTDDDWKAWNCEQRGIEREEIGEDEVMKLIGAPMLPGLE